ncbi:MAG: 6-hydroxymethylpterin diphosphokinase MptE-like protein [Sphaerospermopsis kisseleviana]
MQNLKELLADYILAPKTLFTLKYGISKIRTQIAHYANSRSHHIEYASILDRNNKLRNIFKGKRCFVIGNGPSINRQNLSLLKNEVKIVCNAFLNHEILKEWQPTIYCTGSPASSHSVSDCTPFYQDLFKKISPLFYVFHYSVLEQIFNSDVIQIPSTLGEKVLGFASYCDCSPNNYSMVSEVSDQTQIEFTRPLPGIRNTTMLSIMIAIYMGCNPIILIGCDHDYVYKLFRQEYEVEHFYPESTPEVIPKNSNHLLSIADDIFKTYSSYDKLNRIALKQGVRILDATDNGFLDTFNKIDYTSLFQHKGGVGK